MLVFIYLADIDSLSQPGFCDWVGKILVKVFLHPKEEVLTPYGG